MRKKLLLRLCLILTVTLTVYSCRTDQFPEAQSFNDSSKFQLTSKRISLDDAKHKTLLLSELEKSKVNLKKFSQNISGKTISYADGVTIDTDNVTYIENGPNYHTYTFYIKRENAPADAPLENLVLSPMADGTYKELLITYNLSPLEKEQLQSGIPVDLKDKATITKLNSGTYSPGLFSKEMVCHTELHETYTTCSANEHNHGEEAYSEDNPGGCKATTLSVKVIVAIEVCNYSGGGSSGEPGNPPGTGGGDGSGEGGTDPNENPCNDNGVLTGPQQPGIADPNGCNGIPSTPTLPSLEDMTPCEILKRNSNNTKFQVKLDSIKQRVLSTTPNRDTLETMITVRQSGQKITYQTFKQPPGSSGLTVSGQVHSYDIANIHNHPEKGLPIFSPGDLVSFYRSYNYVAPFRKNAYTFYVVCANGTTYAMRMEDTSALDAFFTGIDLSTDEGKEQAAILVDRIFKGVGGMDETLNYTPEMAERMFLKSLKSPELGGGNSLSLYQQENGVWKKLTLSPDESIKKTPCPL